MRPAEATEIEVVSGPGGASVGLPLGTADEIGVSVAALDSLAGLPPTGDPAAFAGGIRLEPHGATFETPVTVTIPLTKPHTPGRQLRLYYWDGSGSAWNETDFLATVGADGRSASGGVTHFSYYVLQPSGIGAEADGIFGDISGTVNRGTRAGDDEATLTQAVFDQAVAHVNARFPLFEPVPLDVPVINGYNCYSPVGIFFLFDHGSAGLERPLVITIGDIDDVEFRIDYIREVDVAATNGDLENQVVGTLVANIYWRSEPPKMEYTADRSVMWAGESAAVKARLTCGGEPMENLEVDFKLLASPTDVTLSQELGFTDSSGSTTSTVSAGELASGVVLVEADHLWTDQPGDISLNINETVQISLGGLTGTWVVSGTETWTSCTEPTDNGTWGGSGDITITQLGETFTGAGTFPRTSERIIGTISQTGPTGFTVEGTTNYTEDWGECDADGCYEWFVSGTAEFTGTGSIGSDSMDFTWKGRDLSGDTCNFSGKGTAKRR